jgi:hypothetical protein
LGAAASSPTTRRRLHGRLERRARSPRSRRLSDPPRPSGTTHHSGLVRPIRVRAGAAHPISPSTQLSTASNLPRTQTAPRSGRRPRNQLCKRAMAHVLPRVSLIRPDGHLAHSAAPEDLDGLRTYLDRIHVRQRLRPIRRTADLSAADLGGRSALRLASTTHETARRESGTVSGMCWFWPVGPLGCRSPQMPSSWS